MVKQPNIALIILLSLLAMITGCSSVSTPDHAARILVIGSVKADTDSRISPISLAVGNGTAGYLMCFHQDQTNETMRFYPNRFDQHNYIAENSVVSLPGDMPFALTSSQDGSERIGCFLTETNIFSDFPDPLKQGDFTPLPYAITELKTIFDSVTKGNYHYAEIII